jgi:hypothetical protein
MEHAGPEALTEPEDVLKAILSRSRVKEHRPGYCYCKGKSLMHFHVDPSRVYADAKIGVEWVRRRVTSQAEKTDFFSADRARDRQSQLTSSRFATAKSTVTSGNANKAKLTTLRRHRPVPPFEDCLMMPRRHV